MPTSPSSSSIWTYLFFLGEPEQQQRFFKELRFISIATLTFGVASWLVTVALMQHRHALDVEQACVALIGMVAGVAVTLSGKTLRAIIVSGSVSVLFVTYGFRVLVLATDDPSFWVLPLGVMITLTIAPLFSGIAYYLAVSLCVWAMLGWQQFPSHPQQADQYWPMLAVVISGLIGLSLNVYFLVLRIHNYQAQRELASMAYTDSLTGLNNRRWFTQRARQLHRTGLTPAYFLMIDIDDFKRINDEHGHDVGDEVLRRTAEVIAAAAGEHLCGRLGGEEFAVIYQGDKHGACTLAAQLIETVEAAFISERKVSVSIGVAELVKGTDLSHGYRRADESLYLAKKNGKNRYELAGG